MSEKGVYSFIEQLDKLTEMCNLFTSLNLSVELISDLPLTDDQVEFANAYVQQVQEEWEDGFIILLEFLLTHLKKRQELRNGDDEC